MCYAKPGPRCSKHARERLARALKTGDEDAIREAKSEYLLTPHGIANLRSKGEHEQADTCEQIRAKKVALYKQIVSLVNRKDPDYAAYYAATDAKHFSDKMSPGSKFTDPSLKRIEDVLTLAARQRGSLDGDDRERFISLGSAPSAFLPGNHYLLVEASGTVGIKSTAKMKGADLLEVVRTKPGVPCNLVTDVFTQQTTNYGVIILSNHAETGAPMLITTFPGPVTKSPRSEELDALEGQFITVTRARKILGEDVFANTRLMT